MTGWTCIDAIATIELHAPSAYRPARIGMPATVGSMTAAPVPSAALRAARGRDDRSLAMRAVAGDGAAFAQLYDRHERRAFNLAYRITGSEHEAADATQEAFVKILTRLPALDGETLDFGSYLLTSVRHAAYDVISRARRAAPAGELPQDAVPVGVAAPPPEEDPDRNVLLAAQQEEIRAANASLPPRQREALALRELEDLSYDEIAAQLEMNRNSVAQLISRARIGLRGALRRTALAAVAGDAPDCERALPLIALRDDRQLAAGDERLGWLRAHLASCERCALGAEAMAEAATSYRAWALVPAIETLRRATIAEAAERLGHDWSDVLASPRPTGAAGSDGSGGHAGRLAGTGGRLAGLAPRRPTTRSGLLTAFVALAVLLGVLVEATGDAIRDPLAVAVPPAPAAPATDAGSCPPARSRPPAAPRPLAAPAAATPATAGPPARRSAQTHRGGDGRSPRPRGSGTNAGPLGTPPPAPPVQQPPAVVEPPGSVAPPPSPDPPVREPIDPGTPTPGTGGDSTPPGSTPPPPPPSPPPGGPGGFAPRGAATS